MCNFEGKLVAWIDGELSETDSLSVVGHLRKCAACRERLDVYRQVSRDFAACYAGSANTVVQAEVGRRTSRRTGWVLAAAAALILMFLLLPRGQKQVVEPEARGNTTPPAEQQMIEQVQAPESVPETNVKRSPRRESAPHKAAADAELASSQPMIQIAIPADTVFPPGAVPEGVAYITNLSFSPDGSFHEVRLQQ